MYLEMVLEAKKTLYSSLFILQRNLQNTLIENADTFIF